MPHADWDDMCRKTPHDRGIILIYHYTRSKFKQKIIKSTFCAHLHMQNKLWNVKT
ncbi:hypothetical protein Hanom_Chr08g00712751 [Helianthus anomalus]